MGVKMTVRAYTRNNTTGYVPHYCFFASFPGPITKAAAEAIADNAYEQQTDYKQYSGHREIKRYINIDKFRKRNGPQGNCWLRNNAAPDTEMTTYFRYLQTGFGADIAEFGTVQCTWYVKFKQDILA